VRGGLGRRLSGRLHQPGHIHLHRWRTARQVALNPLQPLIQVALVPARNLHAPDAQWLGDVLVLQALRASSTICARCANLTLVGLERTSRIRSRSCSFVREMSGATLD
jgi:hypothetical protein